MPVQGKPTNPPPYWQMPQKFHQANRPMTKPEYCAVCELKQLVDKIGQNLCSPNCLTCSADGKGCIRPSTAMPSMQYTSCAPSGDVPLGSKQFMPPPAPPQLQMGRSDPPVYFPQPIPTYQWPAYSAGMYWPPQQQIPEFFLHNRAHPYLPVQIDVPTEDTRKPKLPRSKSANFVGKANAELRSSVMIGCECTKKNGLQDTCPRLICKDMPRVGTIENPAKVPCKLAPCKGESIFEEEEDVIVKAQPGAAKEEPNIMGDRKEVPVKDVPQKPKTPKPCKPECQAPCNKNKK